MTGCKIEGCANTLISYALCREHSACDQPKSDMRCLGCGLSIMAGTKCKLECTKEGCDCPCNGSTKPDTTPDAHDIAARAYVLPPLKYPDADWANFPDDHPAVREAWCLADLLRRAAADAAKAEREACAKLVCDHETRRFGAPVMSCCKAKEAIEARGTGGA
jgi:hypothetical protein